MCTNVAAGKPGLVNIVVKVSVILPTYNRSRSLPAAINSVLSQSETDLELIVVDDCSTEDISALIESMKDPRLRYVRRTVNGGAGAARNTGLREAKGQFFAFQDSDDLWLPGKLKRQLELFSGLPATVGVVTAGKILYGRDDRLTYGRGKVTYAPRIQGRLSLEEDQVAHLLRENRISLQNTLFKRDCYPDLEWFDPAARANEDWDFAVRLVQHTKIFEDDEPAVLAFVSVDSISRSWRRECIGTLRILKKNKGVLQTYRQQRAALLYDVSRTMFRTGKPRLGRRLLLASLATYPPGVTRLVVSLVNAVRKRLLGK